MALETDPRKIAIQAHARNLANQDIAIPNRLIYARKFETALQILLSGGTLSADDLAQVDARNLTYPYLEAVRQEGIRCINNPNLTVADFVDPDPNAPVNYTRPSIWNGIPWVVPRTNFPKVASNTTIAAGDMGAAATAAGIVITLPPIATAHLDGAPYSVKNIAAGIISVATSGNDLFTTQGGQQTSEPVRTDVDLDFIVCSTDGTWLIK